MCIRDSLNTTYQSERVIGVIDDMADTIAPQMPNHIARWNKPKSLAYWQSEVGRLRTYASLRPGHLWGYLNTFLGTPGMVTLTVNHNAARGHGHLPDRRRYRTARRRPVHRPGARV